MNPPPGYISAIWTAWNAGILTNEEAVHLQNAIYDPCDNHTDRPGKAHVGAHRWCETCFAELYPAWKKEHDGGVPV